MNIFYEDIGSRIKKKRIELRLTREGLAQLADISDKFIYDIEVGKKGMSAETLYKISQGLGVSADWLLGSCSFEDDRNNQESQMSLSTY